MPREAADSRWQHGLFGVAPEFKRRNRRGSQSWRFCRTKGANRPETPNRAPAAVAMTSGGGISSSDKPDRRACLVITLPEILRGRAREGQRPSRHFATRNAAQILGVLSAIMKQTSRSFQTARAGQSAPTSHMLGTRATMAEQGMGHYSRRGVIIGGAALTLVPVVARAGLFPMTGWFLQGAGRRYGEPIRWHISPTRARWPVQATS